MPSLFPSESTHHQPLIMTLVDKYLSNQQLTEGSFPTTDDHPSLVTQMSNDEDFRNSNSPPTIDIKGQLQHDGEQSDPSSFQSKTSPVRSPQSPEKVTQNIIVEEEEEEEEDSYGDEEFDESYEESFEEEERGGGESSQEEDYFGNISKETPIETSTLEPSSTVAPLGVITGGEEEEDGDDSSILNDSLFSDSGSFDVGGEEGQGGDLDDGDKIEDISTSSFGMGGEKESPLQNINNQVPQLDKTSKLGFLFYFKIMFVLIFFRFGNVSQYGWGSSDGGGGGGYDENDLVIEDDDDDDMYDFANQPEDSFELSLEEPKMGTTNDSLDFSTSQFVAGEKDADLRDYDHVESVELP